MPELDKNPTPSAHSGTNTYLEVAVFPRPYARLGHNYNNIINKNGSQLLQLCQTFGMYIVNGRRRGDSYGGYTYSSSLGSSIIE
jgi:hypothetical protein